MARSSTSGQGRPKGIPNKATVEVREAIAVFAKSHVHEMSNWLNAIPDPAKRLDLYLRALEYHVPKLGRVELTGQDGGPFQVIIQGADSAL